MWRKLIYLYLIYVVIEGALRKWVLPEYSNALFVLKDLILAAAVIMLVMSEDFKNKHFLNPNETIIWQAWVFLFCALAAVSGFSITTAAGLRYYLAALPLAIVLPHLLTDWNDIRRVVRISLYVSIAICMVGVVQYASPTDSDINRYAWGGSSTGDVASFGVASEDRTLGIEIDRPRITGTFSYISTYAVYLQFMFLVAWAAVVTSRSNQERTLALISLLLLFMNISMTGSRGALLISVILSIPFMVLLARQSSNFIFQIGIAAAVVSTAVGGLYAFSDPFNLVLLREEGSGDSEERILGALLQPINTLEAARFFGTGIGSTFAGLEELGSAPSVDTGFEEAMDRIGIESGVVGYLFVFTVKLFYLIKTWTLVRQARSREIWIWSLVSLCYQLSSVWSIPLFNAVASAFYFASLGLYYWLRDQNAGLSSPGFERADNPLVLRSASTGR